MHGVHRHYVANNRRAFLPDLHELGERELSEILTKEEESAIYYHQEGHIDSSGFMLASSRTVRGKVLRQPADGLTALFPPTIILTAFVSVKYF